MRKALLLSSSNKSECSIAFIRQSTKKRLMSPRTPHVGKRATRFDSLYKAVQAEFVQMRKRNDASAFFITLVTQSWDRGIGSRLLYNAPGD